MTILPQSNLRRLPRLVLHALACVFSCTLLPAFVFADVPEAVLKAEAERVGVLDRICQATVAIFAANGQGGGSGVLISANGYALSNFHVTSECGIGMKCGLNDGKLYDA